MNQKSFAAGRPAPANARPLSLTIWMIVSQLLAGLILIPWFGLLIFASMIGWPEVVEAEGGWNLLHITFSLLLCYPLFAIVPIIGAWLLFARRRNRGAAIVTSLPVVLFMLGLLLWRIVG